MSDTGVIVEPDGTLATRQTRVLTDADAKLLREYQRFLRKYELREALYCNACFEGDLEDGCRASVTLDRIGILCRCQLRIYQGQTP